MRFELGPWFIEKPWRAGLAGLAVVGLYVLVKFLAMHHTPNASDGIMAVLAFGWMTFLAWMKRKSA